MEAQLCRHCDGLIYVHNGKWEHCAGDWFEVYCDKKTTIAEPYPFGVFIPEDEREYG